MKRWAGIGLIGWLAVMPVLLGHGPAVTAAEHAGSDVGRKRIIEMAEQRYHARVVRVDNITVEGRAAFQLRLLSDAGRIWTVRVDARNGAALEP